MSGVKGQKSANATSFGASRGNTPKPSRSPVATDVRLIRQRYREGAARTLNRLIQIAAGELTTTVATAAGPVEVPPSFADQIRAADQLAKYGIGTTVTPTDDQGKTLHAGVLAVPMPLSAKQWGTRASRQQAALEERQRARPTTK
jgi:hypothetical protein